MPITACYSDLEEELAATRRMLERYPDGKGEWRPHAKSRTIGELANHIAGIPTTGSLLLTTDGLDITTVVRKPAVDSAAELLARFDESAAQLRAAFEAATDDVFNGQWAMRAGDHVLLQGKRRNVLRRLTISHMIHHRAQLGVYFRLLDIPVPGTFGPSADE